MLLTSLTILGLNRVGRLICLFVGSAFQFGFLPSKPCFSLKPVRLNLCYTEVNHNELVLTVSSPPIGATDGDWFQLRTSIDC